MGLTIRQRLAALVLLILLAVGGILIFIQDSRRGIEFPVAAEEKPVYIHLSGAVQNPGVVKVAPGTRVFDALKQAGGALSEADLDRINLARFVEDGEQLYIPKKGETAATAVAATQDLRTKAKGRTNVSKPQWTGPLDLNRATAVQLETVPGIGPALAARIVEYRKQHGPFKSYEELDQVSGIGKTMLEKFRPYLYVK